MGDDAAASPDPDSGLPVIRGKDYRVPVAVTPVFEEIAGIADGFCRQHLNGEYAQLSIALTAKLARKRPSPLLRGNRRIWASAVIYALGRVNFLSGPSQTPPRDHTGGQRKPQDRTQPSRDPQKPSHLHGWGFRHPQARAETRGCRRTSSARRQPNPARQPA